MEVLDLSYWMSSTFVQMAFVLFLAFVVGSVGVFLKQPLIVSFIFVGILAGPAAFNVVGSGVFFELFSSFGIAILLFMVGLKLDVQIIRNMGPVALATGLGQIGFTSIVGFLIASLLGYELIPALYIAVALTFSSTIIIVKLLSDKKEIDALHGRIAVGFLIVQDLAVVLVLIFLSAFGGGPEEVDWVSTAVSVTATGFGLLLVTWLSLRYVFPKLLPLIAGSRELLILFSISWAVLLATISDQFGLSKEVGAFLAGISLASSDFRESIGSRLVALRDFFLLFFFVKLGAGLDFSTLGEQSFAAILFSVFVLVGNPLIVILIMSAMGYKVRTGFLAGLTVAQISEFSLLFAAIGLSLGHINEGELGLITLVGITTIGLSTYMILYSHPLYEFLSPYLQVFQRKPSKRKRTEDDVKFSKIDEFEVLIFGLGRYGIELAESLKKNDWKVLGIDFNPDAVKRCQKKFPTRFGDLFDAEFVSHLSLKKCQWVVSTVSDYEANLNLYKLLEEQSFEGKLALTAHHEKDAKSLGTLKNAVVLKPFEYAAVYVAEQLFSKQ